MKKQNSLIKTVALAISPLLLSLGVILVLVCLLAEPVGPYISLAQLLLSDEEQTQTQEIENIFKGYEDTGEKKDVIDGNTIDYPGRGDLYARLKIEAVNLDVDVYFDTDKKALTSGGVGQHYSSKIPGYGQPILICGHNNRHFNALQYIEIGDILTMTTNYGVFEYQVRETAVKKYWDKDGAVDLGKQQEELVLYTCYPFTKLGLKEDRFFVYADKISGPVVLH